MQSYPALLELATQTLHPLGVSESFLVGRSETADVCVFDPACSRHHFRIIRLDGQYCLEPLNSLNPTLLNGNPIVKQESLEHGAFVEGGQTRFQFLIRPIGDEASTPAPPAAKAPETLMGAPLSLAGHVLDGVSFPLSAVTLIGREEGRVQVLLPHPQVSRQHACIVIQEKGVILTDLNSANGTFVNGRRILGAVKIEPGDEVDIGPYALQFNGTALLPRPRSDNIELVARGVERVVKSRDTGQPLKLLDDVSIVIRPREFVCLLGPSGSGKSTLLSALSGRTVPDQGVVLVNGRELHANFEALKHDIALVPQKDVLHDALAVEQALWYTAKLRLPPDTSKAEIESTLGELLATVGLTARRGTIIRYLSGGQVKRASLANEILCKPSLLFLDEVTSGLDEQTDREVMNLFRALADAGKTVVCITHSLANVERTCHLVVILTPGGKLAFVGKPSEALSYFNIERLGDVYDRLMEKPAAAWQQEFRANPLWQRYVQDRMPAPVRVQSSRPRVAGMRLLEQVRLLLRQAGLVTSRYAAIWRSDYPALLAMVGQALVVAVLLAILFGNLDKLGNSPDRSQRTVNLMFLLAVSSFWFGCNNSAKEIVKERTIYTRERDFNLRICSYYTSKLLLLTLFSWVQTVVLFTVVHLCCAPPGPALGELVVLLGLALAGVTIGLAISAFAGSEEMAITLIPMAVIPQIILSGTICPLEGWSERLAMLGISTYWGKRGLDACLPEGVARLAMPPVEQHSAGMALLVICAHVAVGVAVALTALHWQGRRRA